MNYFKSILAGLVAVFLICILFPALPTIVGVFIFVMKHRADGIGIAGGPVSWRVPSLGQWLFMFAVFGGGFLWKLRRLEKQRPPLETGSTDHPIS